MPSDKEVTAEQVIEEVHLLYYVEKELSMLKEDVRRLNEMKESIDQIKREKERMKNTLFKMRRIAVVLFSVALVGIIALTVMSCDMFLPDFSALIEEPSETDEKVAGTLWYSDGLGPYISIEFSSDGKSFTAVDEFNIPYDGIVMMDMLMLDEKSYSFERNGNELQLISGKEHYSYRLNST